MLNALRFSDDGVGIKSNNPIKSMQFHFLKNGTVTLNTPVVKNNSIVCILSGGAQFAAIPSAGRCTIAVDGTTVTLSSFPHAVSFLIIEFHEGVIKSRQAGSTVIQGTNTTGASGWVTMPTTNFSPVDKANSIFLIQGIGGWGNTSSSPWYSVLSATWTASSWTVTGGGGSYNKNYTYYWEVIEFFPQYTGFFKEVA